MLMSEEEEGVGVFEVEQRVLQKAPTPTMLPTSLGSQAYMSFWNAFTFTGLNAIPNTKWYLTVQLMDTGFGGPAMPAYKNLPPATPITRQGVSFFVYEPNAGGTWTLVKHFYPPNTSVAKKTDCATLPWFSVVLDFDVTRYIQPGQGGSLLVYMASEGFDTTSCFVPDVSGASIQARYTLNSGNRLPSYPPAVGGFEMDHMGDGREHEYLDDDFHGTMDNNLHITAEQSVIPGTHTGWFVVSLLCCAFIYIFMALRIMAVRSGNKGLTPLHAGAALVYFGLLGMQFGVEIVLGAIIVHNQYHFVLGLWMVLSRCACWLPGFYTLSVVWQRGHFKDILNEEELDDNSLTYMIFNVFVINDTQLLTYFPWTESIFTKNNFGLPDTERVRMSLAPKAAQIIISAIVQGMFMAHLVHDIDQLVHEHDEYLSHEYEYGYADDGDDSYGEDWDTFYAQLLQLETLSVVALVFTLIVLLTVLFSAVKHTCWVPAREKWDTDVPAEANIQYYGENPAPSRRSSSGEAGGGRQSFTSAPPPPPPPSHRASGGRHSIGITPGPPPFVMAPFHHDSPQHRPSLHDQAFRGRPSLDGRRSSLGSPPSERRVSGNFNL